MKKIPVLFFLMIFFSLGLIAQSTGIRVFEIFQEKCISCHGHNAPQSGLDLEGAGITVEAQALYVYNNIFNVTPDNSFAAGKGYKYIYPGRTDRSYLFRKISDGLEQTIHLETEEGEIQPPSNEPQLTDEEKELIRQWILYGAPAIGEVIDEQVIYDFYNENGLASFPNGAPEPPAESEGFQIKMGPFFLRPSGQPGDELEYFQKYELNLPENVDVTRVDIKIASSSHHFIMYDFDNPSYAQNLSPGLRLNPYHNGIGLVAAVQEATDLKLPQGTAFIWENNLVLDLNSHYINYSATNTYQAEVYVNIYTQPSGMAAQVMKTELIVNNDIYIDNNGNEDIETQTINSNFGEAFVWGIMGHTHQWGTGYKVFKRENGVQGELIYDASCALGVPGCASPYFDYRHIPMLYYEPFLPITFNTQNGIIHEATYENNGPSPVWFGPTSDDEMMVMILMYTEDTTGVVFENPNAVKDVYNPLDEISVFPSPAQNEVTFTLPIDVGEVRLRIFDVLGREMKQEENAIGNSIKIQRGELNNGIYLYRIEDDQGHFKTGKILFE